MPHGARPARAPARGRPEPAGPDRAFLIVPDGAVHPMTGSGQRTRMIFDGLRAVCPTTVLLLGVPRETGAEVFYPGARAVIGVPGGAFELGGGRLARAFGSAGRLRTRLTAGAGDPALRDALRSLMAGDGRSVAVFRYYVTFARSGIVADPAAGLSVIVDVDDRDDRKVPVQMRARLGRAAGTLASRLLEPRMRRSMTRRLRCAGRVWVTKEADRFGDAGIAEAVVPNVPAPLPEPDAIGPAADGRAVLFVGSAGYRPNRQAVRWFLDACWGHVRRAVPDAELRIVGFGDWSGIADRYGRVPGVAFVGAAETIAAEYARARLAISPVLEGAGSQIKVIEAAAFARPAVATRLSASGFGPEIEAAIDATDDPAAFAARCVAYLRDGALATERGRALQRLQRRHVSREATLARIAAQVRAPVDLAPEPVMTPRKATHPHPDQEVRT